MKNHTTYAIGIKFNVMNINISPKKLRKGLLGYIPIKFLTT